MAVLGSGARWLAGLLLSLFVALGWGVASTGEKLAPGDPAPEFTLRGSDGRTYTLSQFVGKRGVVLAWFPKAFTPG